MIIFLNHRDRLFCDVFETANNNNDYFTIIAIIGPTINHSDASLKSTASVALHMASEALCKSREEVSVNTLRSVYRGVLWSAMDEINI